MIKKLLGQILFLSFPLFAIEKERRLGKLEANDWTSHYKMGSNSGEFQSSSDYPDLAVVGALKSVSTGVLGTATLVAPNVAVTAAQVVKHSDYDQVDANAWEWILNEDRSKASDSDIYQVQYIEILEDWTDLQTSDDPLGEGDYLGVDLALIHLDKEVAGIYPALLPRSLTDDPLGMRSVMAGFGVLVEGSSGSKSDTNLRAGGENMIDRSVHSTESQTGLLGGVLGADFDSQDGENNTLGKGQLLDQLGDGNSSSSPLSLEASTAVGDSGGPAFVRTSNEWRIHGVVSYGTNESKYGDVTVFTRLASHLDWIKARLPSWPSSRLIGYGKWKQSPWFGTFFPYSNNWNYHLHLGWLYIKETDTKEDVFWGWNSVLSSWLWIYMDAYPWVYALEETQRWLYIDESQSSPQKIRAYDERNGWVDYSDL